VARFGFTRLSQIQRRIHREYVAAKEIRPVAADGRPTVLLLGNSLMLAGVDMPALNSLVSDELQPSRYVIENTQFLDWYFALRRLFEEGARPSHIVLGLVTNHLASRAVLGEYFGHYMMDGRDVVAAASAAGLDSTAASNLLFANWSSWLGSKAEMRNWVAGHAIPDTVRLAGYLAPAGPRQGVRLSDYRGLVGDRLNSLKSLCRAHGAEISILLMPNRQISDADVAVLREAGASAGVQILIPLGMRELPESSYLDGFHLNQGGADLFTHRLSIALRNWVAAGAAAPAGS